MVGATSCPRSRELVETFAELSPCIGDKFIDNFILNSFFLLELAGGHEGAATGLSKGEVLWKGGAFMLIIAVALSEVEKFLTG